MPTEPSHHKGRPEDKPEKPLDLQAQEAMSEHNSGNKVDHEEKQSENPRKPESSYQKNESFMKLKDSQNENKTELKLNKENTTKKHQSQQMDKAQSSSLSLNNSLLGSVLNQSSNGMISETFLPKPVIPLETGSSAVLESEDHIQTDKFKDSSVIPSVTPETTTKTVFQTTLNIETSSSVQLIQNTNTLTEVQSTTTTTTTTSNNNNNNNNKHSTTNTMVFDLEPSQVVEEDVEIKSSFSTPTDGLTSFVRTTESSLKTYNHPLHSTSTFVHSKTPGNFYILIREGIRFMQNVTPSVFVKCPRFETL